MKPETQNRRWLWFFVLLGALATAGITTEVWFNESQQLTPQTLAAARARWREDGPRDYALEYAVKREDNPDPAPRAGEKYVVRVKDGQVEEVTGPGDRPPRPGEFEFGSMDDLFDRIDQRLRADRAANGPRAFVEATFDRHDGHVVHYVHSVMRTRERLEVTVEFRAVTASPP